MIQTGAVVVYDARERQMLRRVGAGRHAVDCVAFDTDFNFLMTVDTALERMISKYNLKGEKVKNPLFSLSNGCDTSRYRQ